MVTKSVYFVPNVTRSSNTSDQNDSFKEKGDKIMSKKKSISRRDFIKTTAVGGPTLPVPQPDRYDCFQIEIIIDWHSLISTLCAMLNGKGRFLCSSLR
jgi:hypothetical protein